MKQIIREQNERSKRLGRIFEMISHEPKKHKANRRCARAKCPHYPA
ncbi:hypothetical protein [Campylobacter devanensis]|nr:hypothetical protein [Campylobacter sp. P155]